MQLLIVKTIHKRRLRAKPTVAQLNQTPEINATTFEAAETATETPETTGTTGTETEMGGTDVTTDTMTETFAAAETTGMPGTAET
jgi:hypothetical protein